MKFLILSQNTLITLRHYQRTPGAHYCQIRHRTLTQRKLYFGLYTTIHAAFDYNDTTTFISSHIA
jgi:hypothetical protein